MPKSKVFARLFQKAAGVQGAAPHGRAPLSAELSMLKKVRKGGPYQGVSPLNIHTCLPPQTIAL